VRSKRVNKARRKGREQGKQRDQKFGGIASRGEKKEFRNHELKKNERKDAVTGKRDTGNWKAFELERTRQKARDENNTGGELGGGFSEKKNKRAIR